MRGISGVLMGAAGGAINSLRGPSSPEAVPPVEGMPPVGSNAFLRDHWIGATVIGTTASLGAAVLVNVAPTFGISTHEAGSYGSAKILDSYVLKDPLDCLAAYDTRVDGTKYSWKLNVHPGVNVPGIGHIGANLTPGALAPTITATAHNLKLKNYICLKDSALTNLVSYNPDRTVDVTIPLANSLDVIPTRTDPISGIDVTKNRAANALNAIGDISGIFVPGIFGGVQSNVDSKVRGMVEVYSEAQVAFACLPKGVSLIEKALAAAIRHKIYEDDPYKDPKVQEKDINVNLLMPTTQSLINASGNNSQVRAMIASARKHHGSFKFPKSTDCGGGSAEPATRQTVNNARNT